MYLRGYYFQHKDTDINKGLRDDANNTLAHLLKCAIGLAKVKPEELVKSCLVCDNFDEQTEICKMCNMRPPARIIAFGCPSFYTIEDEIPF